MTWWGIDACALRGSRVRARRARAVFAGWRRLHVAQHVVQHGQDAAIRPRGPGGWNAILQNCFIILILDPNLMLDKNTESVIYVQALIETENKIIRVLKLISKYKGYEQSIIKFFKTSF